ncbi:MAG: hypothetical protein KBT28_08570 [Bacteroidales bacterium]|nr:hypothetical protein [Candidatus Colimorpha merdihippi]
MEDSHQKGHCAKKHDMQIGRVYFGPRPKDHELMTLGWERTTITVP